MLRGDRFRHINDVRILAGCFSLCIAFVICAASAQAETFVYQGNVNAQSTGSLWIMEEGGAPTAVQAFGADPALSADGGQIVYTGRDGIYVSDGSVNERIYGWPCCGGAAHPQWGPEADTVIHDAGRDIELVTKVGGTWSTETIIDWPEEQTFPSISPDGGKIAFLSETDPSGAFLAGSGFPFLGLYVADIDGSNPELLTSPDWTSPGSVFPHSTSFSPDGSAIAFYGGAEDDLPPYDEDVFTVDVATGATARITDNDTEEEGADWLADGRIAYKSENLDTGATQYHTIRPNGSWEADISAEVGSSEFRGVISGAQPTGETDPLPAAFMPNLHFDTSETWRPVTVESFLAEDQHQLCTGDQSCTSVDSPDDLAGATQENSFLDIAGQGGAATYFSSNPACTSTGLRDCQGPPQSKIYYHQLYGALPGGPYSYLDYWFFYRFNDSPGVADAAATEDLQHEGDWEGVTLAVASPTASTFDFASFSQHGHYYSYLRDALSCDGGGPGSCGPSSSHVDAYVATRSHANYPRTCSAIEVPLLGGQVNCGQDGDALPEGGGYDGASAWTGNGQATALERFPTAQDYQWQYWSGRWGATGAYGSSSPASPGNQPHFSNPGWGECPEQDAAPNCQAGPPQSMQSQGSPRICEDWFGAGVAIAVCDQTQLRQSFSSRALDEIGSSSLDEMATSQASAPGLLQVVDRPLRPGARLTLRGASPNSDVFIAVAVGAKTVRARFKTLPLDRRSTGLVIPLTFSAREPKIAVDGVLHSGILLSR
jgi:hypothetical protein